MNTEELHLKQLVLYMGKIWRICSVSDLLDDPRIHIVPPDDDTWENIIELWEKDFPEINILE